MQVVWPSPRSCSRTAFSQGCPGKMAGMGPTDGACALLLGSSPLQTAKIFICCVTLGMFLYLSESPFPHLRSGAFVRAAGFALPAALHPFPE